MNIRQAGKRRVRAITTAVGLASIAATALTGAVVVGTMQNHGLAASSLAAPSVQGDGSDDQTSTAVVSPSVGTAPQATSTGS